MCDELVSCAEFRAIPTPFREVIRKPDNFTKRRQNGSYFQLGEPVVSAQHKDKVGGIRKFFVGRVTCYILIRNIALLISFLSFVSL